MNNTLISSSELQALRRVAEAARDVVERWDTPLWKDVEPTACVINRLRHALDAVTGKTLS